MYSQLRGKQVGKCETANSSDISSPEKSKKKKNKGIFEKLSLFFLCIINIDSKLNFFFSELESEPRSVAQARYLTVLSLSWSFSP